MIKTILLYTNVVVLIQSVVLLVELLVNFKRPGPLKSYLLASAFALIIRDYGHVHLDHFGYNRWVYELTGPLMIAITLSFFSLLYQHRHKRFTMFFLGAMVVALFTFHFFYSFVWGYDASVYVKDIAEYKPLRSALRIIFIFGVLVIFMNLFFKINKKYNNANIYHAKLRRWSMVIAVHLFLVYLLGIYQTWASTTNELVRLSLSVVCFSFILTLLFRPKFLNNSSLKMTQGGLFNLSVVKEVSASQFTELFFNQLYFLNREASLEDFSKLLDTEAEDLYRFVYANYNIGFNDLLNKNRVDYFIELVNSKKFPNYTIDALAQEAGFSSRHHLYKPFKKFHGGSPSDFLRSTE